MELTELKGVGEATAVKLEEAGFGNMMSLAAAGPEEISPLTGMSEAQARKLIAQARKNLNLGFEPAVDYAKKRLRVFRIKTGAKSFDDMLGGGFESGFVTEIYGWPGAGKSQTCHLIAVRGAIEGKSIFIDSENSFRTERIIEIAKSNGLDPDKVMKNIFVSRSYNSSHQMLLMDEVEKMVQKDNSFKVLIIDSLTSHFRSDYTARGQLAERQQKLNKHLHQIVKLADLYNLVVIMTNQVMAQPVMTYGDPVKPIGGFILGHMSGVRVYLRPGKKGSIKAKMHDSPYLPDAECNFAIVTKGLEEVTIKED